MKGVENESRMTRTAMEIKIKQLENVIAVQNWTINLYQEIEDARKDLNNALHDVESD